MRFTFINFFASHSGHHFLCCWIRAEKQNLHWTPGNGAGKGLQTHLVCAFTFEFHPSSVLLVSHLSLLQAFIPVFLFLVKSCLVVSCCHLFSWNKPPWFCCTISSLKCLRIVKFAALSWFYHKSPSSPSPGHGRKMNIPLLDPKISLRDCEHN